MPVTARLSKKFYDTLGEDIAQELVDWFNQVDATYRGDLRDLNELNFARFDAKLEQRMVELEARLERRMTALEATLERTIAEVRGEITGLDDRMATLFAQANARMEAALASQRAELIKWTFIFVVGTAVATIGVLTQLLR